MLILPVMFGPNITGTFEPAYMQHSGAVTTGALTSLTSDSFTAADSSDTKGGFALDASLSNSIYSNSETVQPQSNQVLIIIKV